MHIKKPIMVAVTGAALALTGLVLGAASAGFDHQRTGSVVVAGDEWIG